MHWTDWLPRLLSKPIGWVSRRIYHKNYVATHEGIAICDCQCCKEVQREHFRDSMVAAMELIRAYDLRRWRRVQKQLAYIVHAKQITGGAFCSFAHSCHIDFAHYEELHDEEWRCLSLARVLVHEATHGVLSQYRIRPKQHYSLRAERLCHTEEIRFARRVWPDVQWDGFDEAWYREYFSLSLWQRLARYRQRLHAKVEPEETEPPAKSFSEEG